MAARGIVCSTCKKKTTRNDEIVECKNGCKGVYHLNCAGISSNQLKNMVDNGEISDWMCSTCKSDESTGSAVVEDTDVSEEESEKAEIITNVSFVNSALKNENKLLKQLIEEQKKVNDLQKQRIIDLEQQVQTLSATCNLSKDYLTVPAGSVPNKTYLNTASQQQRSVTYANAFKQSTSMLLVKSLDQSRNSEGTYNAIKKIINPSKLSVGINQIKETKNGDLLINCNNKESREKLQLDIEKAAGKQFKTKIPTMLSPKLVIIGVEKDDAEREDLCDIITKQNPDLF
ncbi:hypothetical protein CBL_21264, partial [Carabus blaptoides fortunei]